MAELIDGSGSGYGSGYGDGYGSGYGSGYGDGSGSGYGHGFGAGEALRRYAVACRDGLTGHWVLAEPNAEAKRIWIEVMGADRLFASVAAKLVHQDIDGCGNPRQLLSIPLAEAEAGYLQAVRVVCPTTGRVYHLGVAPTAQTCQEAVASTFGKRAGEYRPIRET